MLILTTTLQAQESFKNEEQMIKEADELFRNEEYIKAYEYYQTLLSNHRDNIVYTYRFGVCMLYSDKRDKSKPIKYLEKAIDSPEIGPEKYYFLGRAYHMNYRFAEAKLMYNMYKNEAKSKIVAKYDIDRRIQECENGLTLLSHIHLLYVVNKVEVKESTFYRAYDMRNSGGMVIMLPDELRSKYDKKHNSERTAFYIPKNRIIYFSSYGVKNLTGKDIYRAHQLTGGGWSAPEKLSATINTNYDEAYPYISPDGKTLYFSSKGHNTMGGYDIFKSEFNTGVFDWGEPENMNFPINTPFDDLFFVPDTMQKFANFSSTRSSVSGLIYVYKIGLQKQAKEENFAKALNESQNTEKAVALIKEVAEMKTNVSPDEYQEKIAEFTDTTLAINEQNKEMPDTAVPSEIDVIAGDQSNFDTEEAVDSVFGVYREMQYKLVGFKKKKKTAQTLYHKNKIEAQNILQQQGVAGAKEASKYKKSAEIALSISRELDKQIKQTEAASETVMALAANIQYYNGRGMSDSVKAIYNKVLTIQEKTNANSAPVADKVVAAQFEQLKVKREKASKLYDVYQSYDKDIADLKAERDEYQAEASRITDPESKQEYLDLVKDMDKEIAKKEAEKQQYYDNWSQARAEADSLSEQLSMAEDLVNDYKQNTTDIDFNTMAFVGQENKKAIDQQIAEVRTEEPTEVVAVNETSQAGQETGKNQQEINAGGEIESENITGNQTEITTGNNEVAQAQENAAEQNEEVATNGTVSNQNAVQDEVVAADAWKQNPELVSRVQEVEKSISELEKQQQEFELKAAVAQSIAERQYDRYQEISTSTEKKLSDINLNENLTPDERQKQISEIKNEIIKASELKQEAAVAYNFAKEYRQQADEISAVISKASAKRDEMQQMLTNGEYATADKIGKEISEYKESIPAEVSMMEKAKNSQSQYQSKRDKLIQERDDEKARIESLQAKLNQPDQDKEAINAQIAQIQQNVDRLDNDIDLLDARIAANSTILNVSKDIASNTKSTEVAAQESKLEIPSEFREMESLAAVFSKNEVEKKLANVDAYMKTAIVAQNSDAHGKEEQQIAENASNHPFATEEQNKVAEETLAKQEEALSRIKVQNKELDKRIVASLQLAKDRTEQLKQKNSEIEAAYAELDTTIALSEQKDVVNKIRTFEEQALELNREQEAAIQVANILKTKHRENDQLANTLIADMAATRTLIEEKKFEEARTLVKDENIQPVDTVLISEIIVADYVQNLKEQNSSLENDISSLDKQLTEKQDEKKNLLEKISSLEEKQAIDPSNTTLAAEVKNLKKQEIALNDDITSLTKQLDVIRSKQVLNQQMIASVEKQAKTIEAGAAEMTSIDSTSLERASRVPVVAVNSEVFDPNYMERNSNIEKLLQKESEESSQSEALAQNTEQQQSEKANVGQIENQKVENTEAVNQPEKELAIMLPAVKKNLLESQIAAIDQEIKTLAMSRQSIRDINRKEEINKQIDALQSQKNILQNELDNIELSSEIEEKVASLNTDEYILHLQHQSDSLKSLAADLRTEAEGLRGKDKKEKLKEAENNENIAMRIDLSMVEIVSMNNKRKFYENNSILAKYADAPSSSATKYIEKAQQKMDAAEARRRMAEESGYSEEEKAGLLKEALAYEEGAIKNQELAIAAYKETGIEPQTGGEEAIIAQNTDTTQTRSAEEIPVDNNLAANELNNQENKDAGEDLQIENNTLDTYGITFSTNNANQNQEIPDVKEVNAQGLVYKLQLATYKNPVTADQFNGIGPLAADKNDSVGTFNYVAGSFANYKDAASARTAVKDKGFDGAFVVAYFDGKRISTREAERLIETGEAYTSPELAKLAAENNSDYYSPVIAENTNQQEANGTQTREQNAVNTQQEANLTQPLEQTAENTQQQSNVTQTQEQNTENTQQETNVAQTQEPVNTQQEQEQQNQQNQQLTQNNETNVTVTQETEAINQEMAQSQTNKENSVTANKEPTTNNKSGNAFVTYPVGIEYADVATNNNVIEDNTLMTPKGLVYKVQVAAFRRMVSPDVFKGISPIAAEHAPNSAYIRYMAGVFPNYNNALQERNRIRNIGFRDAFVVAYFDGKRISVAEARRLIENGEAYTSPGLALYAKENNLVYYEIQKSAAETQAVVEQTQESGFDEIQTQPSTNTNIPSIELYYSVQVGVYGGPRSSARLYNIQNLFYDRTASGYYRYFAGKYNGETSARIARDDIRGRGVSDAFVVAFRDGKRISLTEARKLENDARNGLVKLIRPQQQTNAIASNDSNNRNQNALSNQNVEVKAADNANEGVVFRVQLGAFRGARNQKQLQVINSMSENGISSYTTASGLILFFTNSYASYEEARAARDRIRARGYTDVFVVAMQNGKKISVQKARTLLNQ